MRRSAICSSILLAFIIIGGILFYVHSFIHKTNKTKDNGRLSCCKSGRYNNEMLSCVGEKNETYPFALPCRELVPMDDTDLEGIHSELVLK